MSASASASTSTHRMPTVSASEALQQEFGQEAGQDDATGSATMRGSGGSVRLGLDGLDALLGGYREGGGGRGLLMRDVTEVFGPPGVGKTALCIEAASAALIGGGKVVWIDTNTMLVGHRLKEVLVARLREADRIGDDAEENSPSISDCLERLLHFVAPTLPHLLALLASPLETFPPHHTKLVVIDSISALIDNAYPRGVDDRPSSRGEGDKWLAGRRQAVIAEIGNRLAKFAAFNAVSVLVTSNTVTRIRVDQGASLQPAISGHDWECAIAQRICLFRDWLLQGRDNAQPQASRLAMRARKATEMHEDVHPRCVAFDIAGSGVNEVLMLSVTEEVAAQARAGNPTRKRNRPETTDAGAAIIPDDEYGWDFDDEDSILSDDENSTLTEDVAAA